MAALGLQLWLQSQPPGTLVSGTITKRASETSVNFVSAAAFASGSSSASRRCFGAYGVTTSPGRKRLRANTPRPSMALSRNCTGARLNRLFWLLGLPIVDSRQSKPGFAAIREVLIALCADLAQVAPPNGRPRRVQGQRARQRQRRRSR